MIHLNTGKLLKFGIAPFSCHCIWVTSPSQNLILINVCERKKEKKISEKGWRDGLVMKKEHLPALPGDLGSDPSTHMITVCDSSSRASNTPIQT